MTRVSSGAKKSGPPAHANRFAFIHNRNSRLTKQILATPISGVCPTCQAVLEWRKRYRKYKPLSVPKKCVRCEQKTIKEAYHVVCDPCAGNHRICAKCLQPRTENESSPAEVSESLTSIEDVVDDVEDLDGSAGVEDE